MTIEKVSKEEMRENFQNRYSALVEENKKLAEQIKQNEITALKLQGALETLDYLAQSDETPTEIEE